MPREWLKKLDLPESYVSIALGFLVVVVAGLIIYNNFTQRQESEGEKPKDFQEVTQEEMAVDLPLSHTVAENENLWRIAEKYYRSGYNWVVIAEANNLDNPNLLTAGQVLNIPEAETILPEEAQVKKLPVQEPKTYTVVRGDSLWNIALREYGDGYAWTKIAQENNLANPNIIHAGNILKISR